MVVVIQDMGAPTLRNSANITFTVTDINEFPPEFTQPEYRETILSTTPVGSPLLTVQAIDGDAGDNTVTYSFVDEGSTFNYIFVDENNDTFEFEFSIDSNSGIIVSNRPLPNIEVHK